MLKTALDELVQVGSIESWSIKEDLIHVVNIPTMSQATHLVKKLR